ncbi:MAG: YceI family protein, partial [Candidatus Rokuibacteriota bacterium]
LWRLRGALAATVLPAALVAALPVGSALAATERWIVESDKSRVGFDAFHVLGNFSGTSETPAGEVELDIEDLKKPIKGALTVPVASFRTGETGRDKDLRRALDGEHHPEIRYQIDKVESSFSSVAENDVLLTIHGVLSMRGTPRPVAFMGRIRLREGALWVRGESRIRPADFGIPPLRSWLISVKEHVLATFDLVLSRAK